jgi:AAA domain
LWHKAAVAMIDLNNARRQDDLYKSDLSAESIRERLNTNAADFIQWLFSGRALIARGEARIGNVLGAPGASLRIALSGTNSGLWKDHATGEGGDLIALYRANMGYPGTADFALSLKEIARDYFGDKVEIERPAWQPTPVERIEAAKAKLGTKPRADMLELGAPVATYKYFDTRGNVIAAVTRYEPDGTRASKTFRPYCFKTVEGVTRWVPGAPDLRPLYRLPEVSLASAVVLVEGEGKTEALHAVGIVATSAMQGANAPIEKTDWSPLAGKTVTIWPDNDEKGLIYASNVAVKLSQIGCPVKLIPMPADKPAKWDAADCVAEGGDAAAILLTAQDVIAAPKPRIRILDLDELENLSPPSFLIDEVLTEGGLSVIWGRSGAMKSFVALDMAMCVAGGMPWHGKPVKRGLVVYLAAEGSYGLGRRAIGWRRTRGRDLSKPAFKLIPHTVALTGDDLNLMVAAILALEQRPVLIIIDTLARTFGAGDENKQADMNAYVSAADRLREATGANVLIVHHSGVHEDKRERGSNVLRGAADTVIKVSRNDDKIDIINHGPEGKQKDTEEFKTIKLRKQKVFFEQGGNEQSTLILNLREEDESAEPEGKAGDERVGSREQKIIDALKQAGGPLGLTRLKSITGVPVSGDLLRSLASLVEKNLISVDFESTGNTKVWTLIRS